MGSDEKYDALIDEQNSHVYEDEEPIMEQASLAIIIPDHIVGKREIADRVARYEAELLETNDSVSAYVFAKQMLEAAEQLAKSLKPKAEVAWTGAEPLRIGAAKVEFVNTKPRPVYQLDAETQKAINDEEQIIAGSQARIETLRTQAIEQGRATKTGEETGRGGGIKITFDK